MNKTKVNYWVDVIIGISFLASAISGLVYFFDSGAGSTALGLSFRVWDSLHTWGGMIMIAGVAAHLILHWNWIVCMTKRMILPERKNPAAGAPACQPRSGEQVRPVAAVAGGKNISRRAFLVLGGSAAVTTCLAATGAVALVARHRGEELKAAELPSPLPTPENVAAPVSQSVETAPTAVMEPPTPTATSGAVATSLPEMPTPVPTAAVVTLGVACRKGIVNDPYPGRCRDYVDRDGDGICDLSILGSGNTLPRSR